MISGKDLVEYIINHFGRVTDKQLQKVAYLTELEYMKRHGERLSDLAFVKLFYGPYSFGIKEIQDEDENIQVSVDKASFYTYKNSELRNKDNIGIDSSLRKELDEIFQSFEGKTGKELEEIADKTDPFIDAEAIGVEIDLNGYTGYYKTLLSDKFWETVYEKDKALESIPKKDRIVFKSMDELKEHYSQ